MFLKTLYQTATLLTCLLVASYSTAGPLAGTSITGLNSFSAPGEFRNNRASNKDRGDRRERRGDRKDDRFDDRDDRRDDRFDRRDDRYDDRRDERWERYVKYRVGVSLLTLPLRHTRVVIGPNTYFYADGVYLVKRGSRYVVVSAPIGARVGILPYGFRSVWIGPRRYFYVNSTYYVYASTTRDYVVVSAPKGATEQASAAPDPVVYPAEGQTEEQIDQDRYECHRWAMEQSDFDPTRSQQDSSADQDKYNRALKACLEGRGYSVQ